MNFLTDPPVAEQGVLYSAKQFAQKNKNGLRKNIFHCANRFNIKNNSVYSRPLIWHNVLTTAATSGGAFSDNLYLFIVLTDFPVNSDSSLAVKPSVFSRNSSGDISPDLFISVARRNATETKGSPPVIEETRAAERAAAIETNFSSSVII